MHYINNNIKFFRNYKRYTQQDIANRLSTTVGRIKTYESGVAVPQVEMLIAIADMMNISIDTLIKVKLNEKNYGKEELRIDNLERRLKILERSISV